MGSARQVEEDAEFQRKQDMAERKSILATNFNTNAGRGLSMDSSAIKGAQLDLAKETFLSVNNSFTETLGQAGNLRSSSAAGFRSATELRRSARANGRIATVGAIGSFAAGMGQTALAGKSAGVKWLQ